MIKKIFTYFFLFTLTLTAQKFTASVEETTVSDKERFQVSFTFSGDNINNLTNFKPPSFGNYILFSGPNQSTSIQIINGAQSASLTYSYVIQAKGRGTFVIGSASIQQKGTTYETKPITLNVVRGEDKPKSSGQKDSEISYDEIAKNIFIKASVDKTKAYKGDQVTVVYKLYTRVGIAAQMSVNKLPQYQGFWAEELQTPNNISFNTEVVNGKQFKVGVLKKVALFPTQTGKLEVTPLELTIPVQLQKERSRNIWDDFFGDPFGRSQTIDFDAKSNVVNIDVLPLPEGQPKSFKGAVGDFSFEARLNKTLTKSNEPLTLNVKISGSGNIKLLDMPEINLPNGFEKYEPKVSEQINRSGRISGTKTGEYLFVPRVVGKREIPPLEFSYFNPATKKYITLKSESFNLNIEEGEQLPTDIVSKEEIKELGQDIRFIKTSYDDIEKKESYLINSTAVWIASVVPLFLAAGLIGWKRKNDKLSGNVTLLRYQKAEKVAKSRLKLAQKLLEQKNHKEFYTELSLALFGYLEDKLHISKSEFTIERASDHLRRNGVNGELISNLKNSAEKCEFVRFAPGAEKSAAMKEMYDEIAAVIINIEKNMLGKKYA